MSKNSDNLNQHRVCVIGAGLAGSDAAFYLAEKNIEVVLVESKRLQKGPAQKIETFAELVCTNSLKSKDPNSGHGLLKTEMQSLGSLVLKIGHETSVPAGDALAVDRDKFSAKITEVLQSHPKITIVDEVVEDPLAVAEKHGCHFIIQATGPLTTEKLENWINKYVSEGDLYFYDAIAPIVDADSLDFDKLYFKDRHKPVRDVEEGEKADYLNAPLNKEEYERFVNALVEAEKVQPKNFEKPNFFESCLPIDLMAERGIDTPRHSCMKPIGLEFEDGSRPYAVVQLRKENLLGTAFNLVGFQTRLTYKEQLRVFRMLPGLEEASFVHLGSVHRNTFINSKKYLNFDLSSKNYPRLHFAGQMTGVEGYTESAACGLYVASQVYRKIQGMESVQWPYETAIGALINYLMTSEKPRPSNINFGLLPAVELKSYKGLKRFERKKKKKELAAERARETFNQFMEQV